MDTDAPSICMNNLRNSCKNSSCPNVHCSEPYLWQCLHESGSWHPLPKKIGQRLEDSFCDENVDEETFHDNCKYNDANFVTMTIVYNYLDLPIRRLSTPSCQASTDPLATYFQWYFVDENDKSIIYGQTNPDMQKRSATSTTSDDLELAYISGKKKFEAASKKHRYKINFKKMIQTNVNTGVVRELRRRPVKGNQNLSRVSPNAGKSSSAKYEWQYCNEKGKWVKYGVPSVTEEGHQVCSSCTSDDIEESYRNNPSGSFRFTSSKFKYIIDFTSMTQRNLKTYTTRNIRRQIIGSPSEPTKIFNFADFSKSPRKNDNNSLPPHWKNMNEKDLMLKVQVDESDPEYTRIMSLVKIKRLHAIKLERIQNPYLWKSFTSRKAFLLSKSPTAKIDEQFLFHGTGAHNVNSICTENLNWRKHGSNSGEKYGQGAYFAKNASFSNMYTKGNPRCLFIVRVLVGRTCLGNHTMVMPPNQFDTTVDNVANPTIYVKYYDSEFYPEYLLHYSV